MNKHPFAAAIAMIAGLAAGLQAQTSSTADTTIMLSLDWTDTGNGNGVLEPGESAVIRLWPSFTNQFGNASFSPPLGSYSNGTVTGFGTAFLDISGVSVPGGIFNISSPANNGTTGYGVRSGWRLLSGGTINAAGTGISNIQFGQLVLPGGSINTANPILNAFRFLWTPTSYDDDTAVFRTEPASIALPGQAISVVIAPPAGAPAVNIYVAPGNITHGWVTIPIGAVGACCLSDGTCFTYTHSICTGYYHGIYRGDGSTCEATTCPLPGPCCLPNATCTELLETACVALGGIFRGEGFRCYDPGISCVQPCYPNCDSSTTPPVLTANDFQCFLNAFAESQSYANCDGSTVLPILTANDFQCFLNAFAAGCP